MPLSAAEKQESPRAGIIPAHIINEMCNNGQITLGRELDNDQIQPASLDLRLGEKAYRVRASFLPGPHSSVMDRIDELSLHEIDLREGAVLETGCVYIVPLLEGLSLPEDIAAAANPKSSTGRLDVFTRVIIDRTREFDKIPFGYNGPLYAEISPRTFSVLVRTGSRLSQIRFRTGAHNFSDEDHLALHQSQKLVASDDVVINGGVALTIDLSGDEDGLVGFRAKRHSGLIDVDEKAACDVLDYWEPIYSRGSLVLDPDQFYILASKEAVHVPPAFAAEMVPIDPLVGEFRVHYAGFFDPGFGHAGSGGEGARAVLEVRSHEVPFILEDGQTIGRLVYEPLTDVPEQLYGQGIGSNYQKQGLKLSKHFRPHK